MGAASPAFQSLAVAEAVLHPWTLTPFLEATSVQMKEQRPHALPVRHCVHSWTALTLPALLLCLLLFKAVNPHTAIFVALTQTWGVCPA